MQAPARTIRSAVVALVLLALGLAPPALARPHLAAAACLYPAVDPASADLAAAEAAAAPTFTVAAPVVSSADVAPADLAPVALLRRALVPVGGRCVPSSGWDVSPTYTDGYYPDNAAADRAEPPFKAPPATTLPIWWNSYEWDAGHGYAGWHGASAAAGGSYGVQSAYLGHYGLWLWPAGGTYASGDYAEWTYTAPGTTRISTAKLWFLYRNKLLSHHCLEIGLRTASGAVVDRNVHCKPTWRPDGNRGGGAFLADPSGNPTATVLYFRIRLDCGRAVTCTKTIPARNPYWNGAFARLLEAKIKLVDDDQPVVTASDEFRDLGDNYSNGRTHSPLTVSATDAGAGIVRSWAERLGTDIGKPPPLPARLPCMLPDGAPPSDGLLLGGGCVPPPPTGLPAADAPCDPTHHTDALDNRICPETFAFSASVDMNQFPEGTNTFVASSIDPAANVGATDTWTIYVDRTAPSTPSGIQLQSYDGFLRLGTIVWNASSDPALPDGVDGSGVQQYLVRSRVNGGAFGAWTSTDGTSLTIGDLTSGDLLDVEVQAVDRVGNVSPSGTASITVPAGGASSGPVLAGSLVDGAGGPVQGEVAIYLNGTGDGTGQLAVGIANTEADGSFALRLSPENASAVAGEAIQNSGWVNFDVIALSGPLMYSGNVARRIDVGAWNDGSGSAAPLTITMAAGAPGVVGSGPVVRALSSSRRKFQICLQSHIPVATTEKFIPVGELHTGDNQSAYFEYGEQADSNVSVGVSADGSVWKIQGSFHVSNVNHSDSGHGVIYPAGSNFGRILLGHFRFTKYEYFLTCNPNVKWYKVKATKWLVGQNLGANVTHFDHQCLSTYKAHAEPFLPDARAYTHGQRSHTFDIGVSVFGASLDVQSGFSKWAHAEWHFGKKFSRYWLCGNDRDFVDAPRIFAGA